MSFGNEKIVCFIDSFNSGGSKTDGYVANGLSKKNRVITLQYHDLNFFSKIVAKKDY